MGDTYENEATAMRRSEGIPNDVSSLGRWHSDSVTLLEWHLADRLFLHIGISSIIDRASDTSGFWLEIARDLLTSETHNCSLIHLSELGRSISHCWVAYLNTIVIEPKLISDRGALSLSRFSDGDNCFSVFSLEIDDDQSERHRAIVDKMIARIKKPHNYGPTAEERELDIRKEIHQKEKREREDHEERQRQQQDDAKDRMQKQVEWTRKLEQIKREEYQMLDAQGTPLRNFLMAHVMPTLTKALIGISASWQVRRMHLFF